MPRLSTGHATHMPPDSNHRSSRATWEGIHTLNHSSGFAGGAPVSANYKGVREGREPEAAVGGAGRIGRGRFAVSDEMIRAMADSRATADQRVLQFIEEVEESINDESIARRYEAAI